MMDVNSWLSRFRSIWSSLCWGKVLKFRSWRYSTIRRCSINFSPTISTDCYAGSVLQPLVPQVFWTLIPLVLPTFCWGVSGGADTSAGKCVRALWSHRPDDGHFWLVRLWGYAFWRAGTCFLLSRTLARRLRTSLRVSLASDRSLFAM